MPQYSTPQFIDREQKVLGPLTIRQVVLFGAVALILFMLYFYVHLYILIGAAVVLISGALIIAFIKVNGRPLSSFLFSFLGYFTTSRRYTWRKTEAKTIVSQPDKKSGEEKPEILIKNIDEKKVKELADILNE